MRGPHLGWSEVREVATARFDRLERETLDMEVRLAGLIASIQARTARADDGLREITSRHRHLHICDGDALGPGDVSAR